jgi:hypothetical protein
LIVSGSDTSLNCVGWLLNQLGKLTICKGDDVSELGDSGESAGKDGSCVWLNFADADCFDPCVFKPKVETSNSTKK